MAERVTKNVVRSESFSIFFDGKELKAFEGETIAAALLTNNIFTLRDGIDGQPRGLFCNMGVCYECQVHVVLGKNEPPRLVRSCLEPVQRNMQVFSQPDDSATDR